MSGKVGRAADRSIYLQVTSLVDGKRNSKVPQKIPKNLSLSFHFLSVMPLNETPAINYRLSNGRNMLFATLFRNANRSIPNVGILRNALYLFISEYFYINGS